MISAMLLSVSAYSQTKGIGVVSFYNVENLYDTINDPNKNDEEFLPTGKNQWTGERYLNKLNKLNQVMTDMGDLLVMGVCEIENRQVLTDLLAQRKENKLAISHFDSDDARGVDVALFYDSTRLKFQENGYLRFVLPKDGKATRDILWTSFVVGKKQKLYVLVNHWPSRLGGETESEPNRLLAAEKACQFIDSVQKVDSKAAFIFMGDLNDYPTNLSAQKVAERLTPMITKASGSFGGSYNYKNEWDVLDHMMVSNSLFKSKAFKVVAASGDILSLPYMITEYKGEKVTNRTYAGAKYLGGYSDHLPVRFMVKYNLKK